MPNTEKEFQLILAEKLVDDMNRFMKENKVDIPKEFSDLSKLYKKDGKVTFKNHNDLKDFSNKLLSVIFTDENTRGAMLQSAGIINDLANRQNEEKLGQQLDNLTSQIKSQSPKFYNKDNPLPTPAPAMKSGQKMNEYQQELSQWKQKMAVRTGFSKMFHEHIKHIPGKLLDSVKEIMKSSEKKSEQKAKVAAAKKEVKQPSKKKLEQAQKKALRTPGFHKKSRGI